MIREISTHWVSLGKMSNSSFKKVEGDGVLYGVIIRKVGAALHEEFAFDCRLDVVDRLLSPMDRGIRRGYNLIDEQTEGYFN